jgi:hypothetical protein
MPNPHRRAHPSVPRHLRLVENEHEPRSAPAAAVVRLVPYDQDRPARDGLRARLAALISELEPLELPWF